MAQALVLSNKLWEDIEQTASTAGISPEVWARRALKKEVVQARSDVVAYVDWDVVIDTAKKYGRNWSAAHGARRWVQRWNEKHPEGESFHIGRRYGQVHREDLIRALEEAKR